MRRIEDVACLLGCALAFNVAHAQQSAPTTPTTPTLATNPIQIEVVVAHGTHQAGVRDESLRDFPSLFRAPFSNYETLRELSRTQRELAANAPSTLLLPNGRSLQITLSGRDDDGKYRLRVSISRAEGAAYLPLLQVRAAVGEPFLVAGQEYQGGTLIVCVRIRATQ